MKLRNKLSGVQVSVPDALADDLLEKGAYLTPADYDEAERRQLLALAGQPVDEDQDDDPDDEPAKETAAAKRKREAAEAKAAADAAAAAQNTPPATPAGS